MASPSFKAVQVGASLAEALALRCSAAALGTALAVTTGVDSSGNPTIQVGDGVAGDAGAFILVSAYAQPNSYNIIGNVAPVYSPTVVQVAVETDSGSDINSPAQLMSILGQCILSGCRVELWQSANGTAPTASTFSTASNFQLAFEPNMYFPMVSDQ